MISLAAQKFVSDIANDALQHCKMRGSGQSSRKSGKVRMVYCSLKFDLSLVLDLTVQFWTEGRIWLTFEAIHGTYAIYRKVNLRHKIKIRLQNHNQSFSVLGICSTW